MWRRRSVVAVACLLLAGCAPSATLRSTDELIVMTAAGSALVDGADDVPPTLDLHVVPGRDLTVRLDGRTVGAAFSGDGLSADVPPMPLGSEHRLELLRGQDSVRRLAFHVVAPAGATAALHQDPGGGTVLDAVFERAPDRAAVEARIPPGDRTWLDGRHLRVTWTSAPGGRLDLPASVSTDRGSHLAADLAVDLSAVGPGALRRSTVPAPPPQPARPLVLAFSTGTAASRASVAEHAGQISVLSPTGWHAQSDGSLTGTPDPPAVAAATATGLPVWPLVQNQGFDTAAVSSLLGDGAATARLVDSLRRAAAAAGFAGVDLDFEEVAPDRRDDLSAFVERLASGLHADGRRLAVAVVPHKPDHLNVYSAAYDLTRIGRAADLVTLMAYDEHTSATDPGPVAGLEWDGAVLTGTLADLPAARALLGMPLYARTWAASGTVADGYAHAVSVALAAAGARVDYDFGASTPMIVAPDGQGGRSTTWFDDADSLARKVALVPARRMGGVAVWRLGFEDPAFWSLLPARAPHVP